MKNSNQTLLFSLLLATTCCQLTAMDQVNPDVTQPAADSAQTFAYRYSPPPGLAPDKAQEVWSEWDQDIVSTVLKIEAALISEELDPVEFRGEAKHILCNIAKFSDEDSLHLLLFAFGDQESRVLTLDEMLTIVRETNEETAINFFNESYLNSLWGAQIFTTDDTQTLQFILENAWKTMNSSEEIWRGQKLANLSFFTKLTIQSKILEKNDVSCGVVAFILERLGTDKRASLKTLGILRAWLEQEEEE